MPGISISNDCELGYCDFSIFLISLKFLFEYHIMKYNGMGEIMTDQTGIQTWAPLNIYMNSQMLSTLS